MHYYQEELLKAIHRLANEQISINDFLTTYTYSLEDALRIAKKESEFTKEEISQLSRMYNYSLFYQTPFDREAYKECCAVMVDGKKVKPTDQQIDACLEYIRDHEFYECDFTVRTLIAMYLSKKIDMKSENSAKELQDKLEVLEKKKLSLVHRVKKRI